MVTRAARRGRYCLPKSEVRQIEALDETIDDANQCVVANIVIDARRQQTCLLSVMPLDKAAHHYTPDSISPPV